MIGTLVFLIFGPILWALDLTMIYGAQSSLCAFEALPQSAIALLIGGVTLGLIFVVAWALLRPDPFFGALTGATPPDEQWPFLVAVMRGLAGLSLLAMVYFASAILLMPTCPALR